MTHPGFRSWDEMQDSTRSHVQEVLQVVMDWGGVVGSIKNNKAMKPPPRPHDDTGRYGGNSTDIKPRGIMYALGWHLSMELGKSLVYYAPKGRKEKTLELYDELLAKFPSVAELYRDDLATLFPGGLKQLQDDADRHGVLSFADLLDGVSRQRPFANSLTVTREEFANQEHKDKDKSFVAKGKWWEAQKDGNRWIFDRNADHDKTKGGEFYWGEYGIGVDFQKTKGLVDILWRGQLDFHATLRSFDTPGSTRFGTSIQITAKGVNAMEKVWDVKSLVECGHDVHKLSPKSAARVTTPHNRLEKARLPPRKKPKTKKGQ
ncbi:hypothetical protein FB45DRAFT_928082 [Roridomyces roridus]|uniref:Tet-like 2OG-Fe(II) oxygenase domain-containing protein n=1 Tax=Roridomyces roridus TaxID=1738132 RepID=A0AAD7BHB1_9AGAR|nr:hypothetical protein FB45DRAFT_928082 [Roridomyces roridus]